MTEERKLELFDSAIAWIWEETINFGVLEYVNALKHIGYTHKEVLEELENECIENPWVKEQLT